MNTDNDSSSHWMDFEQLGSTIDHWYWRPGWRKGRSFLTWHLTFGESDPVRNLATFYQDHVDHPFLDPVPIEGLHLTIQGIGFTDEVEEEDLAGILEASRRRLAQIQPFALTIGPAGADEQGVPLAVRPRATMVEVRGALRAAIADTWGQENVPEASDGFQPHVTLFYCNRVADPAPLREDLRELLGTPPVATLVQEISLIKLNRDQKVYVWETLVSASLGGGRPSV